MLQNGGKETVLMPKMLPEVFVSNASMTIRISREMKKGGLRKLGSRVYTTNLVDPPEVLIRRYTWFLVEALFPKAIIADRTALEHRPAKDGSVFIISQKKRAIHLPGLKIIPRKGHGPLPDDKPFMGGLYLSSPARAYLENMHNRRSRRGSVARTLSRKEIEDRLEMLLQHSGVEALQKIRDAAREICLTLHLEKEYRALNQIIGALLGTRKVSLTSEIAIARAQNLPYDPKRLDLFQVLYAALQSNPAPHRTIAHPGSSLPFFESYFSNFIEGTEFEVDEAAQIIFEGKIPKDRPEDAHDILGTYQIAFDLREMQKIPSNPDEFIQLLKHRHATLMQGRPEQRPGHFKMVANKAGSTHFVAPDLVEGTLRKGFQWYQALDTPFHKAIFMMFLVAEVHPFADGNGRSARLMMNSELVTAHESRIIIPTIYRNNYLAALKALSNNQNPEPIIRVLDFAQQYTSLIPWTDYHLALKTLEKTHAFDDANTADELNIRLTLPKGNNH
jgi:hypothetical protein